MSWEGCVDVTGLTIIQTGVGSGGPGLAKGGDRTVCVMPGWVGRLGRYL